MSGGSFDYACYRVDQFADELGLRLDEFDKKDEWGYQPNKFEPETLAKLREIEALARHTAKLMKEAEWLYSGDTSDDSFMMRVTEIESSNVEVQGRAAALAPRSVHCNDGLGIVEDK